MKLELVAVTVVALGSACSAPPKTSKTPDLPTLQAAAVLGPFEDRATVCRTVYTAGPDCLKRSEYLVQ